MKTRETLTEWRISEQKTQSVEFEKFKIEENTEKS